MATARLPNPVHLSKSLGAHLNSPEYRVTSDPHAEGSDPSDSGTYRMIRPYPGDLRILGSVTRCCSRNSAAVPKSRPYGWFAASYRIPHAPGISLARAGSGEDPHYPEAATKSLVPPTGVKLSSPVAEAGDRSISFHESGVTDVTQPLPDRYVLFDPTDAPRCMKVGATLSTRTPAIRSPRLWMLDGCDNGEVDAVESGWCCKEQHPIAESDRLGGV